jgi:glutamine amidotransferase
MCVIVHQPSNGHLDKERCKNLWNRNDDGGGYAFINKEGKIEQFKSLHFQTFWSAFEQARSVNPDTDFMVHLRIGTHGSLSLDNVHPFQVDEHTWMSHNGVIGNAPTYPGDDRSDTRVFVEEILPKLPELWLDDVDLRKMVEGYIGGSKLMFLTTDERLSQEVYILNKQNGTIVDNMWFSNTFGVHQPHKPKLPAVVYDANETKWDDDNWDGWVPVASEKSRRFKKRKILTQIPTIGQQKDTLEATVKRSLQAVRQEQGLEKEFAWSSFIEAYSCYGCDDEVSEITGMCSCLTMWCQDCNKIANNCDCNRGAGSSNLIDVYNLADVPLPWEDEIIWESDMYEWS